MKTPGGAVGQFAAHQALLVGLRAQQAGVAGGGAAHASGLRESKNAYGRNSAPIAEGLVYDINAPHDFGLRESNPNAMHTYGRSSAPIPQGLVYDINAPHAYRCRGRVVEAHTVSLRAPTGKPTGAIGKRTSGA